MLLTSTGAEGRLQIIIPSMSTQPFPSPSALFTQCVKKEKKLLSWDPFTLKNQLLNAVTFKKSGRSSSDMVATPAGAMSNSSANLSVVQSLKAAKTDDDFWFLLAIWLKQEAVREPEDFLPTLIYARLTRKVRERLRGISFSDMKYFELVRCWERYFISLLQDKRQRSGSANLNKELSVLGYVSESVELIMHKNWRSAVELACEWLSVRHIISAKTNDPDPASTLRNAYSRIKARTHPTKAPSKVRRTEPAAGTHAKKAR
jgi:hypothetical protein